MCDNNGNTFIAKLHNVLLVPDLCNKIISIIMSINPGYTCLFQKRFIQCNLATKRKMWLPCYKVHKGNMHFGGK